MATPRAQTALRPAPTAAVRQDATRPAPHVVWALGFLVWTALALLSSLQTVIALWSAGQPVAWGSLLPRSLLDWYTCAVFTPGYFWMVRRWPLQREGAARTLAIYAVLTSVAVVLKYVIYVPALNLLQPARALTLSGVLTGSFIRESVAFWCMLAVILAIEYWRTEGERAVRESRLQTQLAEARLDALAAQLNPHFLFNTIQGISTLIHRDADAADAMLARMSTLLRHTLQRDGSHEITLAGELELLDLYLGIVQERFGERLTVDFAVDPAALDVHVPRFVLQPLVENALQHGIARSARAGVVTISARREAGSLALTVADDGPGPDPAHPPFPRGGIGLSNTRERLAQLYGERQRLVTSAAPDGGFVVTVTLPARM